MDLASRQKNPPKTADDIRRLGRDARAAFEKMLAIDGDKLEDGVVKVIDIDIKKRELGGLLAELSGKEDGTRRIKARPRSLAAVRFFALTRIFAGRVACSRFPPRRHQARLAVGNPVDARRSPRPRQSRDASQPARGDVGRDGLSRAV